jgi:hypothetical protein
VNIGDAFHQRNAARTTGGAHPGPRSPDKIKLSKVVALWHKAVPQPMRFVPHWKLLRWPLFISGLKVNEG